uniref:ADP-ribosylation factor-like protein 4D n=1 Tax=Gouania willdenowi TaxID=441366 RepID=A0A8C5HGB5_GOUWI
MGNHLSDMALCFRRVHVVLVGLDCSGKTSLLYQLKLKEFVQTVQTKSFNTERLRRITGSAHNHGVPVLVLANKQDAPAALGVAQVEKLLGVHELSAHTPRHVHGCSAVDGRGLQTGLETLHHMILKRRKMMKTKR